MHCTNSFKIETINEWWYVYGSYQENSHQFNSIVNSLQKFKNMCGDRNSQIAKEWNYHWNWNWNRVLRMRMRIILYLARETTNFPENDLVQAINALTLLHVHGFSWHFFVSWESETINQLNEKNGNGLIPMIRTFLSTIYIANTSSRESDSIFSSFSILGHTY